MNMQTVWGFKVPPVCTAYWTETDWDNHAQQFRPIGYTGSQFDEKAYASWMDAQDKLNIRRFYASYGFDAICAHIRSFHHA